MTGQTTTPIFKQDGQYLTFTVGTGTVTLGDVIMLNGDGTVNSATTGSQAVVGVAVSANRVSRTATDDVVSAGAKVTVITRGVVYAVVGTGSVTAGTLVEAYTTGDIQSHTSASAVYGAVLGKCLVGASAASSAQVLLTIV